MLGNIIMTKEREDGKSKLNNQRTDINRGIELLLRKKRRNSTKPKSFQVKIDRMIPLIRREFHLFLEFHLDILRK